VFTVYCRPIYAASRVCTLQCAFATVDFRLLIQRRPQFQLSVEEVRWWSVAFSLFHCHVSLFSLITYYTDKATQVHHKKVNSVRYLGASVRYLQCTPSLGRGLVILSCACRRSGGLMVTF